MTKYEFIQGALWLFIAAMIFLSCRKLFHRKVAPINRPEERCIPPKGKFRLMGWDQYDGDTYFIADFDNRNEAMAEAEKRVSRPNGDPPEFSDYYHIYDSKGKMVNSYSPEQQAGRFKVWVDDNGNRGDVYPHGSYDSEEEAVSECIRIVDDYLERAAELNETTEEALTVYKRFGPDPYIERSLIFSAWSYAEKRIKEIMQEEKISASETGE